MSDKYFEFDGSYLHAGPLFVVGDQCDEEMGVLSQYYFMQSALSINLFIKAIYGDVERDESQIKGKKIKTATKQSIFSEINPKSIAITKDGKKYSVSGEGPKGKLSSKIAKATYDDLSNICGESIGKHFNEDRKIFYDKIYQCPTDDSYYVVDNKNVIYRFYPVRREPSAHMFLSYWNDQVFEELFEICIKRDSGAAIVSPKSDKIQHAWVYEKNSPMNAIIMCKYNAINRVAAPTEKEYSLLEL